jgi:hypothetical protein
MIYWTNIMKLALGAINVNLSIYYIYIKVIYIISLILASMRKGIIYDQEGVQIGENYGITTWDLIGLFLFSAVSYFFFGMVKSSLESGLTPGYTLDIFCINLGSQFLICFTRYGWWLYSLVPAYISYKVGGFLWAYIANKSA